MEAELKLCYKYSRTLLAYYSKSFYLSTLLLPRKYRNAVYALYAFCRHVDNLVDKPRERTAREIISEIHFIAEELKIAYRSGESEHPVLCTFIKVAKQYKIPIEHPQELLKGVLMDVNHKRYRDFNQLHLFCYRVAGVVGIMMTYILGYQSIKAFDYAAKLGIAMQLTNILRDIQEDKENGRIYFPLDEMRRYKVREQDIFQERMSNPVKNIVKYFVKITNQYYKEASPGVTLLVKECQFAIYSASRIYREIIVKLKKRDYNPFLGRIYVPQTEKLKIILAEYIKTKLILNHRSS